MSFKELVDAQMKLAEDSPPGFEGTVKAMKDHNEIDNPYALSWWMKNKGYKSHKKASGAEKESIGDDTDYDDMSDLEGGEDGLGIHGDRRHDRDMSDYPEDFSGYEFEETRGKDRLKKMHARRNESIRVEHPLHGKGTVEEISESRIEITWDRLDKRVTAPTTIPFAEAKYLSRLAEEYTDDAEDARVDKAERNLKRVKNGDTKDMKKKEQVDESVVAVRMAGIDGTFRGDHGSDSFEDDIIRFEDLLSEDDDWKKPWEESKGDDSDDSESHSPEQNTTKGADYTNVPRPADSVLTNQENQASYHADPLSTKAGFDAADDGDEPDGDYHDIDPVDAPETPQVRDLEGSSDRGNTRDTGDDSSDTSEVDAGDYDESKPEDEDGGENKMKNESAWLNADDLGIVLTEMSHDYEDDMTEHEMGSGEVAFTKEFLGKLIAAVAAQAPDQAKIDALCAGLESAQSEKGDVGLDVSDWDSVKSAAAAAYSGETSEPVGDGGDAEYDDEGDYDDETDADAEFEDKAEGDGEVAGPEGGEEHEGKTKMMDCEGDMYEKKVDIEGRVKGQRNKRDQRERSMKRRTPRRSQQMENKGGTPIGTGSTSGSGGGSQTDLSKPKSYKGKPVGTGTSGAGGSNSNEYGQKPSKDGGSNNLPEYEKGNQHGADSTVFDGSAEKPAPRSSKPLAAESKKDSRQKIDEAICLGMSSIPGTIRNDHADVPSDADWDDEMKTIKRRAGMEKWWQD